MQEFVLLAGLPGSGKSTLARRLKAEQGFFVVSSDAIRLALNAGVYPRGDQAGDYAVLDPIVWKLTEQAVVELLRTGGPVALDATNLTRERRAAWRDLARAAVPGIAVRIVWCEGHFDSPRRWAEERGYSEEEYRSVRQKLEATVERPAEDEGCAVEYYGSGQ
jgi:predicted kinase